MTDLYGFSRWDRYRQLPHPDVLDAWLRQPEAEHKLIPSDELLDRAERLLSDGVFKSGLDLDRYIDRETGLVPPDSAGVAIAELDQLAERMVPAESLIPAIAPHPQGLGAMVFGLDQADNRERLRAAVARAYRVTSRYAERFAERELALAGINKVLTPAQRSYAELRPLLDHLRRLQGPWRYAGDKGRAERDMRIADAVATLDELINGGAEWLSAMKPSAPADADGDDDWQEDLDSIGMPTAANDDQSLTRATIEEADANAFAWDDIPGSSREAKCMLAALEESQKRLQQFDDFDDWQWIKHRYGRRKVDLTRAIREWQWHEYYEAAGFPGKAHRPDRFFLLRLGEIFSVNFGRAATWYLRESPGEEGEPFAEFVDIVLRSCNWPSDRTQVAKKVRSKISFAGQESRSSRATDLLITDDALRKVAKGFPPDQARESMERLAAAASSGADASLGRCWINYSALLSGGLLIDMNAWSEGGL